MNKTVTVIGGGAAGFFCAIRLKEKCPNLNVVLLEKTNKTLSKLRVSGGGRCNVTHNCFDYAKLSTNYPRGSKFLKKAFQTFGAREFVRWIESHGIQLKTEIDGRMFPISDNSETIAGFFESYSKKLGVELVKSFKVERIQYRENSFEILGGTDQKLTCEYVVLATGGAVDPSKLSWLNEFPIKWIPSTPSLFTFNASPMQKTKLAYLSGVSVADAKIKFVGQKDEFTGPLLITHWGISGPAVLKSSAWMSRFLFNCNYEHQILISWWGNLKEETAKEKLMELFQSNAKKKISNVVPIEIPNRLWIFLLGESQVDPNTIVETMNSKSFNRIIENLIRFPFQINGKTTFKEEFVTAGGICLSQLDFSTCEFNQIQNLFACGELLDIDGITGGFNFQSAWTTSELVANGIYSKETKTESNQNFNSIN
jgi:predicted Rossmann fold flavoprotein